MSQRTLRRCLAHQYFVAGGYITAVEKVIKGSPFISLEQ